MSHTSVHNTYHNARVILYVYIPIYICGVYVIVRIKYIVFFFKYKIAAYFVFFIAFLNVPMLNEYLVYQL